MTNIYFDSSRYNHYRVEAKEHAGNPLVCSAISAVLFALAGMIKNTESIDEEKTKLDPADVQIEFKGDYAAEIVFNMAMIGMLNIQASHPENLKIFLNNAPYGGEKK